MKVSWANGMRNIVVFALLSGATLAHAQTPGDTRQPTAQSGPVEGPLSENNAPVVAIRIVTQDGRVPPESPSRLSVEIGKPMDRAQVSESLRVLYRTGDYADVRAVATPMPGGVRLDFVVRENLFFNQVLIRGLTAPPSDASAAAAMQLSLGQVYRRAAAAEALDRLRQTLREEGLYTAEVSAETVPHADTHQMDVIVHVKPGPRARVGEIQFKNGTEYRDDEILSRLKIKSGDELTSARVQRGTDRVHKFLVKKGHLSARAAVRRGEYDTARNTVPLQIEITEGPQVQVAVVGAKFSSGDLKRLIPIYQEGAVDADLLEEGKRNLSERLERETYFDAEVSYSTETREVKRSGGSAQRTEQVITYRVERGDRHKLVGIEISGNQYFDAELLRSRLQIFGRAFGSRGRFSRRLVDSDAQSMRGLYQANGFLDAKVEGRIQDNYQGKKGDILVRFQVQEGAQTRVASLEIEGNHAFKEDALLGVIGSTPGQAYSDFNVTSDRDNILALYFNEGFPEAQFTSKAERIPRESAAKSGNATGGTNREGEKQEIEEKSEKETKPTIVQAPPVSLVYHIEEGPQTRVQGVFLTGYNHTRPGVIRREVSVKPNEPLREGDVVESQRRLYNLGIFNRITIEPQNPTGSDPNKDIVVLVEEAKRYTVAYGGGFEVQRLASTTNPTGGEVRAAPRGILEITKNNLTGRGDSLSLKLRGSTLQGRALLGYSAPNTFGDSHLSFQATAFVEKAQDINTFTVTRYEGSVQLTDQVNRLTTLLYRYTFRKVIVTHLNIPSDEIPLFNQPTLVSSLGMTWFRDSRNNPADPSKGSFNSADISVADTSIGSSASFLRFFYQNSTYHPIKRRFSFARSFRFGLLQPYRETVSLTFPAPTAPPLPVVIPLPERFFAGGGTSLRGFALNQAGPRDSETGFPVGGQALLVFNQEFRFPMHVPFLGTRLGGALFYDGGNTYSRLSRISFRANLPKPTFTFNPNPANPTGPPLTTCVTNCSNELNYFAHTIGFGVRYATPVGPIRVDLGYQINRPFFVVPCVSSTTNVAAVTNCFKGTQLPRLQIFFNLGSSF
jgi:outer membrane protein insertion porin family